jgi:hypothetical protein
VVDLKFDFGLTHSTFISTLTQSTSTSKNTTSSILELQNLLSIVVDSSSFHFGVFFVVVVERTLKFFLPLSLVFLCHSVVIVLSMCCFWIHRCVHMCLVFLYIICLSCFSKF